MMTIPSTEKANTTMIPPTGATPIPFDGMLTAIGYRPGDTIAICAKHKNGEGIFQTRVVNLTDATKTINDFAAQECNVWFTPNVPGVGVGRHGRGTEDTFARVNALWCDLDVKPGGLNSFEQCERVIADISAILEHDPAVVIASGHGMQPIWTLDDTETDELAIPVAKAMIRAFGAVVKAVVDGVKPAAKADAAAKADSVFDLTHVLRAPWTRNWKDTSLPVPATVTARGGTPIGVGEFIETLSDKLDIDVFTYQDEVRTEPISPIDDWLWKPGTRCGYVERMIAGWAGDTPSARHTWHYSQKIRIESARRNGCFADERAYLAAHDALDRRFQQLIDAGPLRPPDRTEVLRNSTDARIKVTKKTDAEVLKELGGRVHDHGDTDANTLDGSVIDEAAFWTSRESLTRIHQFAQARMVGPWGTLGAVLARIICRVPPQVRLPAITTAPMSLNLAVALVGLSGQGKDGCESCARDAITFGNPTLVDIEESPLGSGEGIASSLKDNETVMFTETEVDSVAALFERSGNTLETTLRKMYCGQQLGFRNRDKKTSTVVAAHTYRCGLIVGVQPQRSDVLLKGADGGTPQRFLWLSVTDLTTPDDDVPLPMPWKVEIPPMFTNTYMVEGQGYWVEPDIPHDIVAEIRAFRRGVLRERVDIDPLDGHRLAAKLKVAVALMFLDSRKDLDMEDWELAGQIMAVSDWTRQKVIDARKVRAKQENKSRAYAADERDAMIADRRVARARDGILRKLAGGKWFSSGDLHRSLKSDIRDYFEPAIDELVEAKLVSEVQSGSTIGYEVAA